MVLPVNSQLTDIGGRLTQKGPAIDRQVMISRFGLSSVAWQLKGSKRNLLSMPEEYDLGGFLEY